MRAHAHRSIPASLRIQGLRLLNLSLPDTLLAIDAALDARAPVQVAFANADCVNIAARDSNYRRTLSVMDWVCIDGIGMRLAGRLLGQPVRDNVNGTDLFPGLCECLAERGARMFLLGGQQGVAEAAACWAITRFPALQIAGWRDGFFDPAQSREVADEIRESGADLLLVGLGAPRQEAWMELYGPRAGAVVTLGVGGLFDYYSGRIPRAPLWMRRLGAEWLFRLLQEPRRLWRRYLIGNAVFLGHIARTLLLTSATATARRN